MSKKALVIIDLQNDYYPDGKWELEGIKSASINATAILAKFRKNEDLVVHVQHIFPTMDAPFFLRDSEGAEIHQDVRPLQGEPVVVKQHINSFRDTNLKSTLENHEIEELVICGAMTHMCVDAATRAANDFGYECTVIHDACATKNVEFNGIEVPAKFAHAALMSALGFAYATIISTDEYLLTAG